MTTEADNYKFNNKVSKANFDAVSSRAITDKRNRVRARKLIGKIIRKNGTDYGRIVAIHTLDKDGDKRLIVITDKDIKIDALSIFRVLDSDKTSGFMYPDGTAYSKRIMRAPKSRGGGHAVTGRREIDDRSARYYENNYKDGGQPK